MVKLKMLDLNVYSYATTLIKIILITQPNYWLIQLPICFAQISTEGKIQ